MPDNVVRILPSDCCAEIRKTAWDTPKIFRFLQEKGNVDEAEMFRVFNMGIGLVLVLAADDIAAAVETLKAGGETVYRIGEVIPGKGSVRIV